MSEFADQCCLFHWIRLNEGKYPQLRYIFHIPNGGWRHPATGMKLSQAGVRPGVPDIFAPLPTDKYHGLWIELKVKGNKPTDNQLRWICDLSNFGYQVKVCYGWQEAIKTIIDYLGLPMGLLED